MLRIFIMIALAIVFVKIVNNLRGNKTEGFRERLGYQDRVQNIARCPTFQCLQKNEDKCQRWCASHVLNAKDAGYCKYKCHEMTEDTINSMLYQYQNFGDALYKFHSRLKI